MKSYKKALATSLATIGVSCAIISGATFALFSSDSTTNIAVTSGKVHVESTAELTKAWSAEHDGTDYTDKPLKVENNSATFTNGGVVSYDAGKKDLSIGNITPGDGVEITIKTENHSTVNIKYETVITLVSKDTTLFDGLTIEVNEEPVNKSLSTAVSDWKTPVEGKIEDIKVKIELPIDADKDYMMDEDGEAFTCDLAIGIYAVQANGKDDTYKNVLLVNTAEGFINALESAQPGDELLVDSGEYTLEKNVVIPSGVSITGAQAGKPASEWVDDPSADTTVIKASDEYTESRLLQILQDTEEEVADVVLDGVMVDCNGKNLKGIFVKKSTGSAMKGIEIKNCAVIDCANDAIDVCSTDGAVIEGNYVKGVYDNGIALGEYKNTDAPAYIRNNIVEGATGTINGAIAVSNGKGDVIISGNTVKDIKSGHASGNKIDLGESAIVVESVVEGGKIIIEENLLQNVEQGIAVTKFTAVTDVENDTVIIRNNIVEEYTTFAIAATLLNEGNKQFTKISILDNAITSANAGEGALYIGQPNHYGFTSTNWTAIAEGNTYNGAEGDLNKSYEF